MAHGLQTFDQYGNLLFDSTNFNAFLIDGFTISADTTRSYPNVKNRIACIPIYQGIVGASYWSDYVESNDVNSPLNQSVDYSQGYPVLSLTYPGNATAPYKVMVYSWGADI